MSTAQVKCSACGWEGDLAATIHRLDGDACPKCKSVVVAIPAVQVQPRLTVSSIHSLRRHMATLGEMRVSIATIRNNLPDDAQERVWLDSALIDIADTIRALNFAVSP